MVIRVEVCLFGDVVDVAAGHVEACASGCVAECLVSAGEGVDAVVVGGVGADLVEKSLVLRPRTIVIRPFSAAAAATLARTSLGPVARTPQAL